jgi:hypothetical protein
MALQLDKKNLYGFLCYLKVIAIIIKKIDKLPHIPSLHSCISLYIDIQDDFLLVCISFNCDLEPDFKIFGEIFIFSQLIFRFNLKLLWYTTCSFSSTHEESLKYFLNFSYEK